jgi:hypothetical protein
MLVSELLVATLQAFGQRLTFRQGYIQLTLRFVFLIKLTEDTHEVRAGRPKIVVFPEGLPKVCLGLHEKFPAGLAGIRVFTLGPPDGPLLRHSDPSAGEAYELVGGLLSNDVSFNANVIYVHTLKSSNFENPSIPSFENRILGELGDPKDEMRLDADLTVGAFTFGYRFRYIGPMWVNAYEDFNALDTACPTPGSTVGCPPNNLDYADIRQYPRVYYHDLRLAWDIKDLGGFGKNFQFYVGVDNVLDRHPPLGSTGTGAGSAIYDIRGRNFYGGFRARF